MADSRPEWGHKIPDLPRSRPIRNRPMPITTIIVDDEPLAIQGLELRLQAFDETKGTWVDVD